MSCLTRRVARKLRIQYPGALYHVINRGNYRRDVFESTGAAEAFERALAEACLRHDWRIHAYVIMRNHYHLALETPAANLVEGMHWLQGTFASRFNRYRQKHGHLFQGRYQGILVEDSAALVRVINYINLNPVRAGIVVPTAAATFRWGSLRRFVQGVCPSWLVPDALLETLQFENTTAGWVSYQKYLATLAGDVKMQEQQGFELLCRGWGIGTITWRRALAREYSAFAMDAGYEREELRELKETRWRDELLRVAGERGRSTGGGVWANMPAAWKIGIAAQLRQRVGAPYRWIAEALGIEHPGRLRMQVHRRLQVSP